MAAEMLSRSTDSAVPCVSVHARACVRSRQHTHPRTHGTHTLLSKTIETEDAVNMGNQKAPLTAAMGVVDGCLALFTKCMCYMSSCATQVSAELQRAAPRQFLLRLLCERRCLRPPFTSTFSFESLHRRCFALEIRKKLSGGST